MARQLIYGNWVRIVVLSWSWARPILQRTVMISPLEIHKYMDSAEAVLGDLVEKKSQEYKPNKSLKVTRWSG
jgi:hypothetical protein